MKNLSFVLIVVFGVLILMIGLWGGSWLCNTFDQESGYAFAAFSTSFLCCLAGFLIIIFAPYIKEHITK